MIHGYLFLTNNNRDRDGHGPEFCKHMNRINKAAGTKITVCICNKINIIIYYIILAIFSFFKIFVYVDISQFS